MTHKKNCNVFIVKAVYFSRVHFVGIFLNFNNQCKVMNAIKEEEVVVMAQCFPEECIFSMVQDLLPVFHSCASHNNSVFVFPAEIVSDASTFSRELSLVQM